MLRRRREWSPGVAFENVTFRRFSVNGDGAAIKPGKLIDQRLAGGVVLSTDGGRDPAGGVGAAGVVRCSPGRQTFLGAWVGQCASAYEAEWSASLQGLRGVVQERREEAEHSSLCCQ